MNTEKNTYEVHIRGEYGDYVPRVLYRMGCVDFKISYGLLQVTCTDEELTLFLRELNNSNYVKVIGIENLADTLIEVKHGQIDNKYNVIDIYDKQKHYLFTKDDIESILESDRDRIRLNNYLESFDARYYVKKSMLQQLISK